MFKNLKFLPRTDPLPSTGRAFLPGKKASSIVEYMIVVMFLLAAFFAFQLYVVRGFSGRWKAVGDVFGGGRQYDPKPYGQNGTLECFLYYGNWVDIRCYEDCLRRGNGFGDPGQMTICRDRCGESGPARDCRNTDFSI